MSDYYRECKRDSLIAKLKEQHHCFYLSHDHGAHVIDWYAARPKVINLLRHEGKSDKEIGELLAMSVSSVRWISRGNPCASSLEYWKKKREDALGKLQWHSELPGELAIILESLGMKSKDDCHIFGSGSFETHYSSIRIGYELIPLKVFNQIRLWIGAPEYAINPRRPTEKEVAKAKRILALANSYEQGLDPRIS